MTPPRTNAIERDAGAFLAGPPSLYRSSVPVDHQAPIQFQVITLVGNLTADPVLKQLNDDRKVCQLRLAVNDVKDQPMFIDVATFGAQADACAKYLTKGRAVAVTGRLVYREWDDNGTRRSRHHIVGRVQFGGRPDGDQPTASTDNGEESADF
jgi:single-strand DNA-binding protein